MKRIALLFPYLILWVGSLTITLNSFVYFNFQDRPDFVIEKLPLPFENLYLWVLRTHVFAAALALPGCLILLLKWVLKRWPKFHRWCGRIVGSIVIGALTPSGFYLAFFAKGGWWGTFGFLLTGGITLGAMIQAIRTARKKQFIAHRRFTLHVFGQLSVAITSRAMLFGFGESHINPDLAYLISLWVPVLCTFGFIEFVVSVQQSKSLLRSFYEKINPPASALAGCRTDHQSN